MMKNGIRYIYKMIKKTWQIYVEDYLDKFPKIFDMTLKKKQS